jgi:hypothetical protein
MENFTFNISLSVLNHLGRNLYRNFITVIGEAISNSWDADAKNVWLYIDKEKNLLVIKDDGVGMTDHDFQHKFLKIGYSKRKAGAQVTGRKRPFIGRKGIGKLALLSCASKIHVMTKVKDEAWVGGIIDNGGLDNAINDDMTPQEYQLGGLNRALLTPYTEGLDSGTIIYFEGLNEGIKNREEYIRRLIALFFRFSLVDKDFKIHLNDDTITINELNELALSTQFVWRINNINDPYLSEKIDGSKPHIKQFKKLHSSIAMDGFIASVEKPSHLKIKQTNETVTLDLYVNGRLREKDLLKHIPSTRVVESYLYGQIHFNILDDETDRFTSSREGVISDDPMFQDFLAELNRIVQTIMKDWDEWRRQLNQDGDPDDTRITKKERKSKELYNAVSDEFVPTKGSPGRSRVDKWLSELSDDASFNVQSYVECFIAENLVRKFILERNKPLSSQALVEIKKWKDRESVAKGKANISYDIRLDVNDLFYLSMDLLANLADIPKDEKMTTLTRDAITYKPVRDAMAHTSLLTQTAKQSLNTTFENIKARVRELLQD